MVHRRAYRKWDNFTKKVRRTALGKSNSWTPFCILCNVPQISVLWKFLLTNPGGQCFYSAAVSLWTNIRIRGDGGYFCVGDHMAAPILFGEDIAQIAESVLFPSTPKHMWRRCSVVHISQNSQQEKYAPAHETARVNQNQQSGFYKMPCTITWLNR